MVKLLKIGGTELKAFDTENKKLIEAKNSAEFAYAIHKMYFTGNLVITHDEFENFKSDAEAFKNYDKFNELITKGNKVAGLLYQIMLNPDIHRIIGLRENGFVSAEKSMNYVLRRVYSDYKINNKDIKGFLAFLKSPGTEGRYDVDSVLTNLLNVKAADNTSVSSIPDVDKPEDTLTHAENLYIAYVKKINELNTELAKGITIKSLLDRLTTLIITPGDGNALIAGTPALDNNGNYLGVLISSIFNYHALVSGIDSHELPEEIKDKKIDLLGFKLEKTIIAPRKLDNSNKDITVLKGNFIGASLNGGKIQGKNKNIGGKIEGNYTGALMNSGSIFVSIIKGNNTGYKMKSNSVIKTDTIEGEYTGNELNGGSIIAGKIIAPSLDKGYTGNKMQSGIISADFISGTHTGNEMTEGIIECKKWNKKEYPTGRIIGSFTGNKMTGGEIRAKLIKGNNIGEGIKGKAIIETDDLTVDDNDVDAENKLNIKSEKGARIIITKSLKTESGTPIKEKSSNAEATIKVDGVPLVTNELLREAIEIVNPDPIDFTLPLKTAESIFKKISSFVNKNKMGDDYLTNLLKILDGKISGASFKFAIGASNITILKPSNYMGILISALLNNSKTYSIDGTTPLKIENVQNINFIGYGLSSKKIIINYDFEANYTGAGLNGGMIEIKKLTGNLTGAKMKKGTIHIKERLIGDETGNEMTGGQILIDDSIGDYEINSGIIKPKKIIHKTGERMNCKINESKPNIKAKYIFGNDTGLEMQDGYINAELINGDLTGENMKGGLIKSDKIIGNRTGILNKKPARIKADYIKGENIAAGMINGEIRANTMKITNNHITSKISYFSKGGDIWIDEFYNDTTTDKKKRKGLKNKDDDKISSKSKDFKTKVHVKKITGNDYELLESQ